MFRSALLNKVKSFVIAQLILFGKNCVIVGRVCCMYGRSRMALVKERCSANLDLICNQDNIGKDFAPVHYIKHSYPNQNSSCTAPDKAKWLLYSNEIH